MSYNDRLRIEQESQVTIPIPDSAKLVAPEHWSEQAIAEGRRTGWIVYYAIDKSGQCWWDGERYSHTPESVAVPMSAVLAAAPDWWANGRRGAMVHGVWYPHYADGSHSSLTIA